MTLAGKPGQTNFLEPESCEGHATSNLQVVCAYVRAREMAGGSRGGV